MLRITAPMRLLRFPAPFSHPEWIFEPKIDGFRAIAHIDGHHCTLISRNGHTFRSWPQLAEEIAHSVRAHSAILDGEIACLDPDGRSNFKNLLFRREWPFFMAFDLLALDAEDVRELPILRLSEGGWVDAWRANSPGKSDFSYVHRSSVGSSNWRIDHAFISPPLAPFVKGCRYSHTEREQGLSDHSVLIVEIDRRE